jgi:prepilin-type N-terminal cleavage/methylation domain-containing protein
MIKRPIFTLKFLPSNNCGFTLLELLIVICLFTFLSGGIYSMYSFFNYENAFVETMKQLTRNNRSVLKMLEFDIKMAGFTDHETKNGSIEDPLEIFDSQNTCCDRIEIKYDLNKNTRIKLKYEIGILNNKNYLFKTKLVKKGSSWSSSNELGAYTKQIVARNLEDFQFDIQSGDIRGNIFSNPCLGKGCEINFVDIYILSKSKIPLLKQKSLFNKSNYYPGNYIYSKMDKFLRKESFLRLRTRNISPYIYFF